MKNVGVFSLDTDRVTPVWLYLMVFLYTIGMILISERLEKVQYKRVMVQSNQLSSEGLHFIFKTLQITLTLNHTEKHSTPFIYQAHICPLIGLQRQLYLSDY